MNDSKPAAGTSRPSSGFAGWGAFRRAHLHDYNDRAARFWLASVLAGTGPVVDASGQ